MCIENGKRYVDGEEKPTIGYKIFRYGTEVNPSKTLQSPVFGDSYGGCDNWKANGKFKKDKFGLRKENINGIEYCARLGIGFHVFFNLEDAIPMYKVLMPTCVIYKVAVKEVFAHGMNSFSGVEEKPVFLCSEVKLLEKVELNDKPLEKVEINDKI
jgi:hypothetical protein